MTFAISETRQASDKRSTAFNTNGQGLPFLKIIFGSGKKQRCRGKKVKIMTFESKGIVRFDVIFSGIAR